MPTSQSELRFSQYVSGRLLMRLCEKAVALIAFPVAIWISPPFLVGSSLAEISTRVDNTLMRSSDHLHTRRSFPL